MDGGEKDKVNIGCSSCCVRRFETIEKAASHFDEKRHFLKRLKKMYVIAIVVQEGTLSAASVLGYLHRCLDPALVVIGYVEPNSKFKCFVLIQHTNPPENGDKLLDVFLECKKHVLKTTSGTVVSVNMFIHRTLETLKYEVEKLKLPGINTKKVERKLDNIVALKSDRLGKQMLLLKSLVLFDRDSVAREQLRLDLVKKLSLSLNRRVSAHLFGSSINGFGFDGCDVDLLLEVSDSVVATRPKNGDCADRFYQQKKVQLVCRALKTFKGEFLAVVGIQAARVPIVKCFHKGSRLQCDLSFKNSMSVLNSLFIKQLFESKAEFFHTFAVTIRYWAQVHNLAGNTGRANTTSLSNYALVMMVIFYLQCQSHFPSVQSLQRNLSRDGSRVVDGWQCGYRPMAAKTTKSIVDSRILPKLLRGFFEFYAHFKYDQHVISPFAGFPLPKADFQAIAVELEKVQKQKTPPSSSSYSMKNGFQRYWSVVSQGSVRTLHANTEMVVQDPFEQNHNVSKAIGGNGLKNWILHCQASCDRLGDGTSASLTNIFTFRIQLPPNRRKRKKDEKNSTAKKVHNEAAEICNGVCDEVIANLSLPNPFGGSDEVNAISPPDTANSSEVRSEPGMEIDMSLPGPFRVPTDTSGEEEEEGKETFPNSVGKNDFKEQMDKLSTRCQGTHCFYVQVKRDVVLRVLQLDDDEASPGVQVHEMFAALVSRIVTSILGNVLKFKIDNNGQPKFVRNPHDRGDGDGSGRVVRSAAFYPAWDNRRKIKKDHKIQGSSVESETAITYLAMPQPHEPGFSRIAKQPLVTFELGIHDTRATSSDQDDLTFTACCHFQKVSCRKKLDQSVYRFLSSFLPRMINSYLDSSTVEKP